MTSRKLFWLCLAMSVCLTGLVMFGCSGKTFVSSSTDVNSETDPAAYIPLDPGLRISYTLIEPEAGFFDVEVTDPVTVAGYSGFALRRTDRLTSGISTFYRYAKGNAIFESGWTSDAGVRILESPFVVGHSWDRYDTSTTFTDPTDNGSGDEGGDAGNSGGDFIWDTRKVGTGGLYRTMTIVGTEDVLAMNGSRYGRCLKVAWRAGESTVYYYWYAAGIGLVKFEEVHDISNPSAAIVGIMTDYQRVKY